MNIFVTDVGCDLGASLAVRLASVPGNRVLFHARRAGRWVLSEVLDPTWTPDLDGAVVNPFGPFDGHRLIPASHESELDSVEELWWITGPKDCSERADFLRTMVCRPAMRRIRYIRCPALGATPVWERFALVSPGDPDDWREKILDDCRARSLPVSMIETPLALSPASTLTAEHTHAVREFFDELAGFVRFVQRRLPDYYDYYSLRFVPPEGNSIEVVDADLTARWLVDNAGRLSQSTVLTSGITTSSETLYDLAGVRLGISVLRAAGTDRWDELDRALAARVSGSFRRLIPSAAANTIVGEIALDRRRAIEVLTEAAEMSKRTLASRCDFIPQPDVAGLQERHTDGDGGFTYYTGGSGPVMVLLNAIGQGLTYWMRLIPLLIPHHRVLIWNAGDTSACSITDQLEDVDRVLEQEQVDRCHILGWCTGPKLALENFVRHPARVLSMIFLNPTLKGDHALANCETLYEQNLALLCRKVAAQPGLAASVRDSLGRQNPNDSSVVAGDDDLAVELLTRVDPALNPYLLDPFATDESTVRYCHQMIDFWNHNSFPLLPKVVLPVLIITAEYDEVASPSMSAAIAETLPSCCLVEVPGASHYLLFDRPEVVADLAKAFVSAPGLFVKEASDYHPSWSGLTAQI